MEDEEDGLVILLLELLLDVGLVLAQELGVQLDVAGLVDTCDDVNISGSVQKTWEWWPLGTYAYRGRYRSQRRWRSRG